jgi:hypothetical protein
MTSWKSLLSQGGNAIANRIPARGRVLRSSATSLQFSIWFFIRVRDGDEGFALWSPMQHAPAIEAALSDMKSLGLKAAARLLLAAAPTVRASLSGSLEQLLRQISGNESGGP